VTEGRGAALAVPVPAASVILLRDLAASGVEAYMLRRPARSSFAADAVVFPGGALDPGDASPASLGCAPGLDPRAAAARLGLDGEDAPRRGVALHLCAVRELFEEAGILLGRHAGGGELGPQDADRLASARAALLAGGDLGGVLLAHGLEPAPERLRYVAHFITPAGAPRRYDTHFFLTTAPAGQEAAAHPGEAVDGGWEVPAALLERHAGDRTALMVPTRILLAELADQPSAAAAAADLGSRPVAEILFRREDILAGRIPTRLPLPGELG
jgi:8-oxo-dGTP pyrophosphatase MutT (NUDIX family)